MPPGIPVFVDAHGRLEATTLALFPAERPID